MLTFILFFWGHNFLYSLLCLFYMVPVKQSNDWCAGRWQNPVWKG